MLRVSRETLSTFTNLHHKTSHQHEEIGKNRMKRDFNDLQKLILWFSSTSHDPFDTNRQSLQTLDSGMIADENINCDDAEAVGNAIQEVPS